MQRRLGAQGHVGRHGYLRMGLSLRPEYDALLLARLHDGLDRRWGEASMTNGRKRTLSSVYGD
jgi:hypothetical protein